MAKKKTNKGFSAFLAKKKGKSPKSKVVSKGKPLDAKAKKKITDQELTGMEKRLGVIHS